MSSALECGRGARCTVSLRIAAILVWSAALLSGRAHGQGAERPSLAGEEAARYAKSARPEDYNLRYKDLRLRAEASLGVEFNDNVFWSSIDRQSDVVLLPKLDLRAFLPVSELNTLNFALGLGYHYYFQTSELNWDRPEVNPDSALALTVFSGDFRLKIHDRFYYLETLENWQSIYQGGQGFISLNNIQRFDRFDNQAGADVDWDLNEVILSASFVHENFVSATSYYDYLTRASEILNLSARFLPAGKLRPGLESSMSWDNYQSAEVSDQWRAVAGPFLEIAPTPRLNVRLGAGFRTVQFSPSSPTSEDINTFEAYIRLWHRVNEWMEHSLSCEHLSDRGWSAGNVERTSVSYGTTLTFLKDTTIRVDASFNRAEETGGLYQENFDYFLAGLRAVYRLGEREFASLSYGFVLKDSELPLQDYTQNRIAVELSYRF